MNNNSAFAAIHPMVLLLYFIGEIVITMFSSDPVILLCSFVGSVLLFAMLSSLKQFLSDLAFYLPMLVLIAVINPLFSHNGVTPLFFMNGNAVTLEAILYGFDISLMLISVVYWCKCFSIVMTTDKFLYIFGRAVPKLSLVLSMALRFIPLFRRKLKEFRAVQGAVGLYSQKGFVNKIASELKVFSALIGWALENSADTANSMKARGYGLKGRTHFSLFKFRVGDLIFLIFSAVFFVVTTVGIAVGLTDFYFYPRVAKLCFDSLKTAVYSAFFVLSVMPFVVQLREVVVWKYSVSKI